MGLDMYLNKVIFVGAEYDHRNVDAIVDIKIGDKTVKVNPSKISTIHERACYWRKANAIHKWFVDNVQDGDDNCGAYWVSIEHLEQLLGVVNEVLEDHSKAEELLPTESGFFFGDTVYDEWYFEGLEYTKEEFTRILDEQNSLDDSDCVNRCDFEYSASW